MRVIHHVQQGFSYWEILVALFLLSFVLTKMLAQDQALFTERRALFLEQASLAVLKEAENRREMHQAIDEAWLSCAKRKLPGARVFLKNQKLEIDFSGEHRELIL